MTSMPRVFIIFLKDFWRIFCNFVPFEILSLYPNIDNCDWLTEHVQWHIDKVSMRTAYVLNGSETFFSHFSSELFIFAGICRSFHNHRTYCDVLLMTF